jgi:hypothetical protein
MAPRQKKGSGVNSGLLAKIVVIVIALATFMMWRAAERHQQAGCGVNCPTDLSSAGRR